MYSSGTVLTFTTGVVELTYLQDVQYPTYLYRGENGGFSPLIIHFNKVFHEKNKRRPFWGGKPPPYFFGNIHLLVHGYQSLFTRDLPSLPCFLKNNRGKTASQTHLSKGHGLFFSGILQVFSLGKIWVEIQK